MVKGKVQFVSKSRIWSPVGDVLVVGTSHPCPVGCWTRVSLPPTSYCITVDFSLHTVIGFKKSPRVNMSVQHCDVHMPACPRLPAPVMASCCLCPSRETQELQQVLLVALHDSSWRPWDIMHTHLDLMQQQLSMA